MNVFKDDDIARACYEFQRTYAKAFDIDMPKYEQTPEAEKTYILQSFVDPGLDLWFETKYYDRFVKKIGDGTVIWTGSYPNNVAANIIELRATLHKMMLEFMSCPDVLTRGHGGKEDVGYYTRRDARLYDAPQYVFPRVHIVVGIYASIVHRDDIVETRQDLRKSREGDCEIIENALVIDTEALQAQGNRLLIVLSAGVRDR